ncbi:failed axon connections-like [Penaeus indicus]|uniref:failed axon connections-like n=1 Tax=Penaeus indicus TaxID=29960 RepID=UPI00300D6159
MTTETDTKPVEQTEEKKEEAKDEVKKEEAEVNNAEEKADDKAEKADKEKKDEKKEAKPKKEPAPPKPAVHKLDFEKDVVYLYQFTRTPVLPSLSPYCLKVETWLRLAGLKYENVDHKMKYKSKKGQLPFVEVNGEEVADSAIIIKELGQRYNQDLDAGLSAEQRNVAHATISMIENHFACSSAASFPIRTGSRDPPPLRRVCSSKGPEPPRQPSRAPAEVLSELQPDQDVFTDLSRLYLIEMGELSRVEGTYESNLCVVFKVFGIGHHTHLTWSGGDDDPVKVFYEGMIQASP